MPKQWDGETSNPRKSLLYKLTYTWREPLIALLFISPVIIHLLVFKYYPIAYSFVLSLHRGRLLDPFDRYLGLHNYSVILNDSYFWQGVRNAFFYTIGSVPVGAAIALGLALLINQKFFGRLFFRVAWYAPVVTSTVAAVQIWLWLYNPTYGLLNTLLELAGLPTLEWLYHPDTALLSLIIMSWWTIAFAMLIYLAALQGISQELYEAADIDGATAIPKFFYITLPLLMPTTFFIIITGSITALTLFEPIYLMTGGGPLNATTMPGYQIYEAAFEFNLWGRASALATIFFFIVLAFTFVQYKYIRESYT